VRQTNIYTSIRSRFFGESPDCQNLINWLIELASSSAICGRPSANQWGEEDAAHSFINRTPCAPIRFRYCARLFATKFACLTPPLHSSQVNQHSETGQLLLFGDRTLDLRQRSELELDQFLRYDWTLVSSCVHSGDLHRTAGLGYRKKPVTSLHCNKQAIIYM
jgi:hypothetical protein